MCPALLSEISLTKVPFSARDATHWRIAYQKMLEKKSKQASFRLPYSTESGRVYLEEPAAQLVDRAELTYRVHSRKVPRYPQQR